MARATLSGVIGPVLTEIHKSSVLAEPFFFFVSDLEVAIVSPQQQQQQPLAWRQQQQWQHTTTVVRRTSRGSVSRTTRHTVLYAPWLCLSVAKLQSWLKKSWTPSVFPSMASGTRGCDSSRDRECLRRGRVLINPSASREVYGAINACIRQPETPK